MFRYIGNTFSQAHGLQWNLVEYVELRAFLGGSKAPEGDAAGFNVFFCRLMCFCLWERSRRGGKEGAEEDLVAI
jgi:hypothetical protein